MKRSKSVFLLLLIFSFVFMTTGCEDSSGFLLENDTVIEIYTFDQGDVLRPGETFPFYLEWSDSEENFDSLEMVILTSHGDEFFSEEYKTKEILDRAGRASLLLPETIPAGEYLLELSVMDTGSIVVSRQIKFYVTEGDFGINSVSVYPPQVNPGSTVIFNADVKTTSDLDPVLVWKENDRVLKEGPLSEIGFSLIYQVPEEDGVYPISVEIYPGTSIRTEDPYQKEHSEIIVTSESIQDSNPLFPEAQYWVLLHFLGNLNNSSDEFPGNSIPEVSGNLFPQIMEGNYGYSFRDNISVKYDSLLFPVERGELQPFSLSLHINAPYQLNTTILSSYTDEISSPAFQMFFNGDGDLSILFRDKNGNSAIDTLSREELPSRTSWLTLSCEPEETELNISWYLDGEYIKSSKIDVGSGLYDDIEKSFFVIGADGNQKGFSGFIDELGVFSRDSRGVKSTDKNIFSFMKKKLYGYDLIIAEGFDGDELPSELTIVSRVDKSSLENEPVDYQSRISESRILLSSQEGLSIKREDLPDDFSITVSKNDSEELELICIDSRENIIFSTESLEGPVDFSVSDNNLESTATWKTGEDYISETFNSQWEYMLIQTATPEKGFELDSLIILEN